MESGLSRTTILSNYKGGFVTQVKKTRFTDKVITVFKVEHGKVTIILKVASTDLKATETIRQIKEEYENAIKAYNVDRNGVARPIDIKEFEDTVYSEHVVEMLFEYCGNDLLTALKDADAKRIMDVMTKVALIMENLEEKKVFHSDLKPENIGINNNVVKILDFGTSMILDKKSQMLTIKFLKGATYPYLAPEVFVIHQGRPTPIDVYAWGISLYQLLTNKSMIDIDTETGFRRKDYDGFLKNVKNLKVKKDTPEDLRQKAIKILLQVLNYDPGKRPSFAELAKMLVDAEYYKNQVMNLNERLADVTRERGN